MFVMLILTASMSPTLSPLAGLVCQLGGNRSLQPAKMTSFTRKYLTEMILFLSKTLELPI